MALLRVLLCSFAIAISLTESRDVLPKRSFTKLGCMGTYDKPGYARLEAICEDCYQMFREPDLFTKCRSNCFKNGVFSSCIDALLLKDQREHIEKTVDIVYGRKR